MSEDQRRVLETQLWNIADELRGRMNADEFRDYILGFIFYKYLSERMAAYANDILQADGLIFDSLNPQQAADQEILGAVRAATLDQLGYYLQPNELFSYIIKICKNEVKPDFPLVDTLRSIFKNIENSSQGADSQDKFQNLFDDIDLSSLRLGSSVEERSVLIAKVLLHLDKIDFKLQDTEADVLGDAYEYLIGQFASGAGKKAGEFYTPQEVSKILAQIVTTNKTRLRSAYDPTCGSGSLLLRIAKEAQVDQFFGQELNHTTYSLARMNMILHGVHYSNFDILQGDTLETPRHKGQTFEAICANPPFSALWSANPLHMLDERFSSYGKLAPSSKADFAFVQHMVSHLADNGTMAVVLPHGVLFRGGAELLIRKYLIERRNYLDAVIGLPANIFYGTSIPTCILVFKKCREDQDRVLFVDASQQFEKVKTQNKLRPEHIARIVDTYRQRSEQNKFSRNVPLTEIESNEYNLNIPRYIDTFEAEDQIDLDQVAQQLRDLDAQLLSNSQQLADYCQQLGISTPF